MKQIFILLLLLSVCARCENNYTSIVNFLHQQINNTTGDFYHQAYERLAYISDTYGPRMWGSDTLEQVISVVKDMASKEGFDNVHLQPVGPFTKWVRHQQSLKLYSPRPVPTKLKVIGLGSTISGYIKTQAIVVNDWDDLDKKKDIISDKIVVYNQNWTTYGDSVQFRVQGAERAAKYGAKAALVKSVTPSSIESVHTGSQHNMDIPIAAITLQDAQMFYRMQQRNQTIVLQLNLTNQRIQNSSSNNLIFEIKGSEKPDQILLMGGHIDSWDTGSQTGANDDGGGFITCFEAMRLLLKNNFRPKRTIRFIAWSGEQWGDPNSGNQAYLQAHRDELSSHIVAFEDDLGSTQFYGFGYSGPEDGKQILIQIAKEYLSIVNVKAISNDGGATDTAPLLKQGVPTMVNLVKDTSDHAYYFRYHHSAGDTMSIINPDQLDSNVIGVAAMFFILADLEKTIPRSHQLRQE